MTERTPPESRSRRREANQVAARAGRCRCGGDDGQPGCHLGGRAAARSSPACRTPSRRGSARRRMPRFRRRSRRCGTRAPSGRWPPEAISPGSRAASRCSTSPATPPRRCRSSALPASPRPTSPSTRATTRGIALQRLNRLDEADAAFAAVADDGCDGRRCPKPRSIRQRRDSRGEKRLRRRGRDLRAAAAAQAGVAADCARQAGRRGVGRGRCRERAIEAASPRAAEFPLSAEAAEAEQLLDRLGGFALDTPDAVATELERAEALFKARKWDQARSAYERVQGRLADADGERLIVPARADSGGDRAASRPAREVFRRYVGHDAPGREAHSG